MKALRVPARIRTALAKASVPASLPEGRTFLVIGPHVWGKGPTFDVAYANARGNGPAVEKTFILQDAPVTAHLDEMGYTRWTWDEGEQPPAEPRDLLRFGLKEAKQ